MLIGTILTVLFIPTMSSCGGKGKRIGEKIYQEYKAASKSDAVQYLKLKSRFEQAERIYNDMVYSPCATCNGYGVVYLVDEYGYAITDAYGNYQFRFCPTCGGSGKD